ncbi:UvrD-helicase domain-containing protein [Arthrobacter sunyaminii]|uniref:DNA 3'-5' helicase n=1 Tax=Arthrobacter sunyaminii TaxID=2816859 RepID=A0A975S6R8_9MICC|nr:UvrD-helicase domain-containing protein [Arthrobacter sunyaminii]MBO0907783.1 UvrD-helicase domain-containing protein [Arthrobacter sunyaminii]QWQ36843.1 UvrD-helicase domain-containing protein [Arthrobacter sunyaminii]
MSTIGTALADQDDRTLIAAELDTTVFVEAGAGSGKTHAMVGRIAALVDSGVDIGSIAAITFTEKAAGELRERLRKTLEDRAGLDANRTALRSTALDRLDAAPIGTIHSFAARLISEYPIEAGVPPLITVVDELRAQLAFERRWEQAQQALFTDPDADSALRVLLAVGVTLDQLRNVAKALDANWDRLRDHPPVSKTVPTLEVGPLLRAAELVLENKSLCTDPEDKLMARFPVVEEWRTRLQEVRGSGDLGRIIDVLSSLPSKGYSIGKQGNWGGDVKSVQQQFVALVEERDQTLVHLVSPAVETVSAILSTVLLDSARTRQRSGELEYHDLLVHARDLLVGETDDEAPARLHLQQRYTHLMLDEFQDTDPVQAEIAVRLAAGAGCGPEGWEDLPVPAGRLFMVGDPKQSIYRFRRADIATFLAARGRAVADPGSEIATLQTNFRSTTGLLEWINSVFAALIQANGTVQPPYAALVPAPRRPEWIGNEAGPAVAVIGRNGAVPGENGKVTAADRNRQEADDVAAAIRVATGSAGQPAWQHQGGKAADFLHRNVELKDICILLPTRTALPFIEDALDAAGVEYRAEASSLVYATQEVTDLLLTLRTLANTADQAALVLTLRSALFVCGDDDLFRWKQAGGSWNLYAPVPEGQETSAVGAALAYLAVVHRELAVLSPAELLERIAADRRILEAATDTPRYRDVWRRVRFVVDQARAWSEATHGGLRDYLSWAASQQDENAKVKESMVPETDMQAVRIMTIHASKGLEFPMVILAGAGSAPRTSTDPALWDGSGNALVHFVKGIESRGYSEAAAAEKEFTEAERRRLLYVACTRAESHLVVSHYNSSDKSLSGLLASVNDDVELAPDLEIPDELVPLSKERVAPAPVPEFAAWEVQASSWIKQSALSSRTSVTALAKGTSATAGTGVATEYGTSVAFHAVTDAEEALPGFAGIPVEHGAVFGTALHRLLELTDLELAPSLPELAAGVAAAAGLHVVSDLEAYARSALESAPVRRAAGRERWLELPIMVPEQDRTVEGIIDLMYREDDGSLVIADFKTDVSVGTEQLAAYWRQLGTYARMMERITGEHVGELVLIFCRAGGAEVLRRTRG